MFERFTEKAIKVILLGQEEAKRLGHNFVGTEQLLLGLMAEGRGLGPTILKKVGLGLRSVRREVEDIIGRGTGFSTSEIPFTPRAKRVLTLTLEESRRLNHNYIGTEHIVLGMIRDAEQGGGVAAKVLKNLKVDLPKVEKKIMTALAEDIESSYRGTDVKNSSALGEFGTNLTKKASQGRLDPCVGRDSEVQRVVQILGRRRKNNPLLLGEPGVGKTAVAEGLAQLIVLNDVAEILSAKTVVSIDIGMLIAGTKYRGEFEERLRRIMKEVKRLKNIILLIDEVHSLVGAGAAEGAVDAGNILKPALSRGELQCIGATTIAEYRKYIERDAALERRFQPVTVAEPSINSTVEILYGLREKYEAHHKVVFLDEAVTAAATLAERYISDRFLPDKAIDLIDEAGSLFCLLNAQLPAEARELQKKLKKLKRLIDSAVRNQDFEEAEKLRKRELLVQIRFNAFVRAKKENKDDEKRRVLVTEDDIAKVVAAWTGVPMTKLTRSESEKLLQLEETLQNSVIGQEEAVVAVSRAIRRARAGIKNPNRPIACFLFSGPTGVGKTELAKCLAIYYFGSEESMIRLDMSEYMEKHSVSKMLGSPPGYIGYSDGGQLTEKVLRKPYTVVLFDEIEKAHPEVFDIFLQIFEDGRLTDSKGRLVNFQNTLVIITSNVGSKKVIESAADPANFAFMYPQSLEGTGYVARHRRIKVLVNEELKRYFRPEFLNRLDEVIVFRLLNKMDVGDIAELMLKDVAKRVATKGIELGITSRFRCRLVDEGYDPIYGARPLRRAITRLVEDSLAEVMVTQKLHTGDSAIVDVSDDNKVQILSGTKILFAEKDR
jgi:ATP-dependent Clp protease ATP-binding subunit ClpC